MNNCSNCKYYSEKRFSPFTQGHCSIGFAPDEVCASAPRDAQDKPIKLNKKLQKYPAKTAYSEKELHEIFLRYNELKSLVDFRESREYPYPLLRGMIYLQMQIEGYRIIGLSKVISVGGMTIIYNAKKVEDIISGKAQGFDEVVKAWGAFQDLIKKVK